MGSLAVMRQYLEGLRAELDDIDATEPEAADLVGLAVEIERLGAATRTRFAQQVATTKAYEKTGHRDAASWLAGVSGESTAAARGVLDLAHKLAKAPFVEEAFGDGKLSLAQAKMVAGAAVLDHCAQAPLLACAEKASFQELREATQRVKRAAAGESSEAAKERRAHDGRFLRISTTQSGGVRISGRLTRLDGARILSVLGAEKERVFKEAWAQGRRTAAEAYLADALVRALCGEGADGPGAVVQLRVDLAALTRGSVQGDERCEIPGVGSVPLAVAQALLADAWLQLLVHDGIDVHTVTSKRRTIPEAVRAALWARDGGRCVVPGCPNTHHLEIDHDVDFARGGPTSLDNLQLLCTHHHRLKTNHGFRLIRGPDGERRWVGPADRAGPD